MWKIEEGWRYRMTLVCSWALLPFTEMGCTGGGAGWGRNAEMSSDVRMLRCFWLGQSRFWGVAEARSRRWEVRGGFNDHGRCWGRMCWEQGHDGGEQVVLHVQGRGRSWGPDPRLVPVRRRASRGKKEERWGMDDMKM